VLSNLTHGSQRRRISAFAVGLSLALSPGVAGADELDQPMEARASGNTKSAQSQARIDKTSDQTDELAAEYRATLAQIDSLRVYNEQLSQLLASQDTELAGLRRDIENVTLIGRQVTPLMLQMVEALEVFVDLDVPFLPNERQRRVDNLKEMMDRADVTNAEKYRAILEAYQIENDYGRTLGTYSGDLPTTEGEDITVDFLRLGRIALVYMTPDERQAGVWDQKQRAWVPLDMEYRNSIRKGLRMARKQTAPDMIRLPIRAAEESR
jgi:hypothetical protein